PADVCACVAARLREDDEGSIKKRARLRGGRCAICCQLARYIRPRLNVGKYLGDLGSRHRRSPKAQRASATGPSNRWACPHVANRPDWGPLVPASYLFNREHQAG